MIVKCKTRSLHNFQQPTSKPEANLELNSTAAYSQDDAQPDMKSKDKANHTLEVDILISILSHKIHMQRLPIFGGSLTVIGHLYAPYEYSVGILVYL